MSQLSADCLYDIFEYLENDGVTLCSCLLVSRLWCEVSVRILWRSVRNYGTIIACLPNESKEKLHRDGIVTSTSTSMSTSPMFNYTKFCKVLSVENVHLGIKKFFKNQQPISTVIASAAKNEAAPQKSPVPTTTPKETVEEKGSDPKTLQAAQRNIGIRLFRDFELRLHICR